MEKGNDMTSDALRNVYQRDGFIVVPDLLGAAELSELREIIAELVAGAAAVDTHTAVYDLEPGHTRAEPKVRRIKTPHKVHPAFDAVVRRPAVMEVLTRLIGPDLRLHSSKLNMKAARYGSPVEWHQDWAFYPHTNDDVLAVGVVIVRGAAMAARYHQQRAVVARAVVEHHAHREEIVVGVRIEGPVLMPLDR